ncbi:MAG: tetratricopeptide repeat protein [Microcoleus vaginatus WJT46-NPBG5]|jgi:tetratricopeptide (TPR) repeat protein|nr:tetratricopeptide repeat protein [Microcoleus vaginatus WJT46-NPBG5]
MRLKRLVSVASTTVLFFASQTCRLTLPVSVAMSPVVAQTINERKAEADRLFVQGMQQLQNKQWQAGEKLLLPALTIYREIGDRAGEGKTLVYLGLAYFALEKPEKVIEYMEPGLVIAREMNDPQLEKLAMNILPIARLMNPPTATADLLIQQAHRQGEAGQFQAAIESGQKALDIYRDIGDRRGEASALGILGEAYRLQGDLPRAIELFQQCLAIAREIKDPQLEKLALQSLSLLQSQNNPQNAEADKLTEQGTQQRQAGQFEAALQSYQEALTIYRLIKDRQGEGLVLANLGNAYNNRREFTKAIEYWQQALEIAQEVKDRETEGKTLSNLGVAYLNLKNYPQAMEYLQQGLAIAREIKDPQLEQQVQEWLQLAQSQSHPQKAEAEALMQQGYQQLRIGKFEAALQSFQPALMIYQQLQDRGGEGWALRSLALGYAQLGDTTKSIDYAQQSLELAQNIQDRAGEVQALGSLGTVYFTLGYYAKAIDFFQQSLKFAREIEDRQGEGQALGNLGNVYQLLGDYPKAIEYLQQDLEIARQIQDSKGKGQALGNLGLVYLVVGDYATAIKNLEQSLAIARQIKDPQTENQVLVNLGSTYINLGDYQQAIGYFQQALAIGKEIKDPRSEGMALVNLGFVYTEMADYKEAMEYAKQSLAIFRKIKNRYGESMALKNLSLALFKEGNLAQAETTLMEAIQVQESLRGGLEDTQKVSIFETQLDTYKTLQQILIAQDKTKEALEISERGRARAVVELLASRLSPDKNSTTTPEPPNIQKIQAIAKEQNATIIQYSIFNSREAVQLIPLSNPLNIENSEPEIELTNKSEFYVWVIEPNGKVTFRSFSLKFKDTEAMAGGSALRKLVTETLTSLGVGEDRQGIFEVTFPSPDPQLQKKSLQLLYFALIQPIADLLPADPNKRVIFIPDQELFRVPFAALIDSDGKYLVEKHTILTAPSIQILELTHKQRQNVSRSGQGALVVGNPSPMPAGFSALLGAEKEAKQVAQLLNTQPLIGSEATKSAVLQQLSNARIIHLATHGIYNEQQPLEGAIALAAAGNNPENDGLLSAGEIFALNEQGTLKLNAELLVLSACNTGRGKITGDGVIGLSRSFITAGIPSIIVSLWAVPDAPTAELMSEFYTNLNQKHLDKAQALRQAMLKMMEKHPNNPRAWAAFTLIGEAE